MTSRLDRLFVLLESETSPVTRRAAARQLGEVQKLHPHELHNLLGRVLTYLRSSTWDTRIAAGQAIEAIVSNVPQWDPPGCEVKKESPSESQSLSRTGRLNFQRFDIGRVLSNSSHLLGSEGKEYDVDDEIQVGDPKERMARQRQQLNARLGLDVAATLGIDTSEIVSAQDLASSSANSTQSDTRNVSDAVQNEMMKQGGLSSREINRARRKARMAMAKQRSRDILDEEEPDRKRIKVEGAVAVAVKPEDYSNASTAYPGLGENVPDSTGSWGESVEWPFETFADQLSQDLLSPKWEVRHGAATALRELLKVHGQGAGKAADVSVEEMEELHQLWLEDSALRLLCVLALDRFGDFVSDQVVAPVRETCAQTLGTVLNLMSRDGVRGVLRVLLQLLVQKDWEARHGGLLGLKYLLAVREDMLTELLPIAYPQIVGGLCDPVDDVGAVAASALIPVVETIVKLLGDQVDSTVQKLWDLLLDQDELTAACNSFMGLLAALISLPQSDHLLRAYQLTDVLPRLWPFLSHSTSSVRKVTLQTVNTLTAKPREDWNTELLQTALRNTFQVVLLESNLEIQLLAEKVWSNLLKNSPLDILLLATCPFVSTWMCLAMQPARTPFDSNLLLQFYRDRSSHHRRVKAFPPLENHITSNKSEQKLYIGGGDTIPSSARDECVIRTRCIACRMLGLLSCYVILPAPGIVYPPDVDSPMECYSKVLLVHLHSRSAIQRQVVGLLMAEWGRLSRLNTALGPPPDPLFDNVSGSATLPTQFNCPANLSATLHQCLIENLYFDEIRDSYTRLLQDTWDFIARLKHYKVPVPEYDSESRVLTLDQIQQLANGITNQVLTGCKLKPKVISVVEESQQTIHRAATQTSTEQALLNISTQSALAQAVVGLNCLPEKLHPVFKSLMESINKEESQQLQLLAAEHLAQLVEKCFHRNPCPNDKVINKLCVFLKADPEFTPRLQIPSSHTNGGEGTSNDSGVESTDSRTATPTPANVSNYNGILTLINQQKAAEGATFRRVNPITGRGPGRPPANQPPPEEVPPVDNTQQKKNAITRRGAIYALTAIVSHLGADLKTKFPKLWDLMVGQIIEKVDASALESSSLASETAAEELIVYLQVLEVTSDAVDKSLLDEVLLCLPKLSVLLKHPFMAVRHMAARCFAALAALAPGAVMNHFVADVLPLLEATTNDAWRQGAIETLVCIIEKMQTGIVPYVVVLIVPVLGRMSDPDKYVRQCGTQAFGTLIQLMPLDGSVPDPPGMSKELTLRKEKERYFISQLFNPKEMEDYKIPVPIKAQLRSYQQSGVNWLAFLNKYKLHGILCDDMGLGKTLQSICILAGDHYTRSLEYKKTGRPDCAPLRSLVICPPTLTGHWVYEVRKFLPREYLKPLQYAGLPADREKLRNSIQSYNLIVASYDIVRKDINFFGSLRWNYVILDEGQYIKNGKTKASKAIKTIVANHRLILSGTPIQNNVLELWSLFDFLMPGYLGTEKQFNARYSRPILASREAKSSQKEQEAGVLAMESLHRQVLPFLLRRMKEDVLQDLPPKITQDYYCDLSPLQETLYEDFARSQAHETLTETLKGPAAAANTMQANTHVFQALRYLQKVCNHPKLVLTPSHPEYNRVTAQLLADGTSLQDVQHAAKLPALKQLLLDCGIGCGTATDVQGRDLSINQHRVLIFCQLKMMLDIIENDLLKSNMHGVTYLRLDGSVPATQRHAIVTRFNKDPSIDILLLTTQVGGLGLNLTGADTVIFVEHDWNPMKDLQAMDRAHRIGQKKVVNVYRLITRGTLEEKIMGLQKFKLLTANTVISSENATMETMGTDQLLDLFSLDGKSNPSSSESSNAPNSITMKSVLSALPDLWDDKQYEEEYDLSAFIGTLRK